MNDQEREIVNKYHSLQPALAKWAQFVDDILINNLLIGLADNVVQIPPAFRVKSDSSYLCKALYRKSENKEYRDPLKEIEDKVATRIVVLKSSDVKDVSEIIQKSLLWKAKITKNMWQEIEDKPDIFNYQSLHIVVSPNNDNLDFENTDKEYLTCEIQVRTLLQHAFAEVSHDSAYKGPYKNDKIIMRHLSKSMALMETTDDYFLRIFGMMKDKGNFIKNYQDELAILYRQFCPDFDISNLDHVISNAVYDLLDVKMITIDDIKIYVDKNSKSLNNIVAGKNSDRYGQLVKQPAILLINYLFDNHRTVMINHWPLSQAALKKVFEANNTAFESY